MHRRKPDNIGFDGKDSLKLFDFGLAKELKPYKKHADGTYHLTANTGSRRYMAPVSTDARLFRIIDLSKFLYIILFNLIIPLILFIRLQSLIFTTGGGTAKEIQLIR